MRSNPLSGDVKRLRKKVEADPARPSLIRSVRGVGYLFAAAVRHGYSYSCGCTGVSCRPQW